MDDLCRLCMAARATLANQQLPVAVVVLNAATDVPLLKEGDRCSVERVSVGSSGEIMAHVQTNAGLEVQVRLDSVRLTPDLSNGGGADNGGDARAHAPATHQRSAPVQSQTMRPVRRRAHSSVSDVGRSRAEVDQLQREQMRTLTRGATGAGGSAGAGGTRSAPSTPSSEAPPPPHVGSRPRHMRSLSEAPRRPESPIYDEGRQTGPPGYDADAPVDLETHFYKLISRTEAENVLDATKRLGRFILRDTSKQGFGHLLLRCYCRRCPSAALPDRASFVAFHVYSCVALILSTGFPPASRAQLCICAERVYADWRPALFDTAASVCTKRKARVRAQQR